METCIATVNLVACGQPATKCLRFLQVGNEPLIHICHSCDEHAKKIEKLDGFLGYTELATCAFCAKTADWEMFTRWNDGSDEDEEVFTAVCSEHRREIKKNHNLRPLRKGDRAVLPPHRRALLQETGLEVLVGENDVILGASGDDLTSHLLLDGDTRVEWVDDGTVKLKGNQQ